MKALAFAALLLLVSAAPSEAQSSAPEASPGAIHVAGNWTLDIRDADGTLVDSHSFHNDLDESGAEYLINILTRNAAHGALSIRILSDQGSCDDGSGGRFFCILQEPGSLGAGQTITRDLEFSILPADGTDPQRIRYYGSFVPDFDDDLTGVSSWFARCDYGEELTCDGTNAQTSGSFTTRQLAAPLSVEAGQTVDVTFELSFN